MQQFKECHFAKIKGTCTLYLKLRKTFLPLGREESDNLPVNSKIAFLSFDLEDISDALCFKDERTKASLPCGMDGAEAFLSFCRKNEIKATIFALANRLEKDLPFLKRALQEGHEIGLHGYEHVLATSYSLEEFVSLTKKGKKTLEDALGINVRGYRAPGWAINQDEYDALKGIGFSYSSSVYLGKSWAMFSSPPSLGKAGKEGYRYHFDGFDEFTLPVIKKGPFKGLLLGGGVVPRFFPEIDVKRELLSQLQEEPYFVLNSHPFEFSSVKIPYQKNLHYHDNLYLRGGKKHWEERLGKIVSCLKENGYRFMRFDQALEKGSKNPSSPKPEPKV